MEFAKLVLLCLTSVCGYGAVLGGISATLCPEAFTLGRPPFFEHWPALALGATWGALEGSHWASRRISAHSPH